MTFEQLLAFLQGIEDKDVLNKPIEVFDGTDFFTVQLVGQLGVDNGDLLLIPTKNADE